MRRAALYLRVSTDKHTVKNQEIQPKQVAERRGWEVVALYDDAGMVLEHKYSIEKPNNYKG